MGKYPVVFVSLKGVDGLTFETAYRALCEIIVSETSRLRVLAGSDKLDDDEKQFLNRILCREYSDSDIRISLKTLCALLEKHYGQKAILLIDEYDNFANNILADHGKDRYEKITHGTGFLRNFFTIIKTCKIIEILI